MADLRIEWVQSADDPSLGGNVAAYELARSTGPNPVTVVANIPATAANGDTVYTETLVTGTYYYRVRAVGSTGKRSLWSNQVQIFVPAGIKVHHVFLVTPDYENRIAKVEYENRIAKVEREIRVVDAGMGK